MDDRSVVALCLILARRRRRRRQREPRKWWIQPILADRSTHGKFVVLHNNLKEHPDKFSQHYRMSPMAFQMLLEKIENAICGAQTVMRESVCPEEKLAVTLRYLSTGNSFRLLHLEFLLGRSTIANIIRDTCNAIWEEFKSKFMKLPTAEDWWKISEGFKDKADFPHCVGAIGGKHIRIVKPWSTASDFFHSKKSCSLVLIAVVDSDLCFRYIDVGGYRTEKELNLFKTTSLGKKIYSQSLELPEAEVLPNDPSGALIPFVFTSEVFTLTDNLLKPYPSKNLCVEKKIFNARISKVMSFFEKAFAILVDKWQIFQRPLEGKERLINSVIKCCCILNSYILSVEGPLALETSDPFQLSNTFPCNSRGSNLGKNVREHFTTYFSSVQGSVPWQFDEIEN